MSLGCLLAAGLAGCEVHRDKGVKIGKMLHAHATANHPIRVQKKMVRMKIPVRRGDRLMSEEKRIELGGFVDRYRREGEGRIVVSPPIGQPNEVAAVKVMDQVREIMKSHGLVRKMVKLSPYHPKGNPEAPIRVSYLGYRAEGPKCGQWSKDAGGDGRNLPMESLACANQANIAAMIANPRDLVEPRDMSPRSGERRDHQWKKFIEGKYMGREKSKEQQSKLGETLGN